MESTEKTPEDRLADTYMQVMENTYIRVMAAASGRKFIQIDPHERAAIILSFKESLEQDVMMLSEIGQQYRLLGLVNPPTMEEAEDDLVLDTEEQ